jgi:hypothetical protein
LQAAVKDLTEPLDVNSGKLTEEAYTGPRGMSASPEEVWQSIPASGEAAWKSSDSRQSQRLRVARLQEVLSEANVGLQQAAEACRGSPEDDVSELALGVAGLGPPGVLDALRNECNILEAENGELDEERAFLDARMAEVEQEISRLNFALLEQEEEEDIAKSQPSLSVASPGQLPGWKSSAPEEANELSVVLRLLSCLKDVALKNRSTVLPADTAKWTREHQVVAYFLDEVQAFQTNGP